MAGKLSKREIEELNAIFQTRDIRTTVAKFQENLESLGKAPLHIGITGESGSGKSSFVNAILDLSDDDEGAAKTGPTQTTMEPKSYPNPRRRDMIIWDLPGTGTPTFQSDEYLKKVNFNKYDFFIIISASRFTSHDANLAREIQEMGKRFYYVRSKMDNHLRGEQRKKNFNKERTLQKIREDCTENLREVGEACPRVFLISSWERENYDFPLLMETLENDLDELKKHVFILGLPNSSAKILQKKKAELQKHILKVALVSCAIGAVPVPGLSLVCDVAILVFHMKYYCMAFGLDDESLTRLAKQVDKPVAELKSVIKKSPMASAITKEFVLSLLSKSACRAWITVRLVLGFVPVLGSLVDGGISFLTTRYLLQSFLDDAAEDAQKILTKALEPKA